MRALYGQAQALPASLFELGISPHINASIIVSLLLLLPKELLPFPWAARLREARKEGKGVSGVWLVRPMWQWQQQQQQPQPHGDCRCSSTAGAAATATGVCGPTGKGPGRGVNAVVDPAGSSGSSNFEGGSSAVVCYTKACPGRQTLHIDWNTATAEVV
jgi:hypothetical protein